MEQTSSLVTKYRPSPESVICAVLASPLPIERMKYGEIADVLYTIRKNNIVDTSRMVMYMNAVHAFCEDWDHYLAKLSAFRYVTDISPVKPTEEGRKLFEEIVEDEKREGPEARAQMEKLEKALKHFEYDSGKVKLISEDQEEKPKERFSWKKLFR